MKKPSCLLALLRIARTAVGKATEQEEKNLYETRCAIFHGFDWRGTPLQAHKRTRPANDLTLLKFQEHLKNRLLA